MFLRESLIDPVREQVSPKEFSHPACQELAEAMFQKRKKQEKVDLALLIQDMDDSLKSQLLSQMFIDEENTDIDRMLSDNITYMKKNRLEKEIKKVQEELHAMQQQGRSDRVASLFERINALMHEKKRINTA